MYPKTGTSAESRIAPKVPISKPAAKVVKFTKMSGAGNDFVMIDNRKQRLQLTPLQIARICHRNEGVGADGLLLAEEGTSEAEIVEGSDAGMAEAEPVVAVA